MNPLSSIFGTKSKFHRGRKNYTTKRGSKVYHRRRHHSPYGSHKGTRSRTRKRRKNYTTKRGSKVNHRKGKYVRRKRRPYTKRRR